MIPVDIEQIWPAIRPLAEKVIRGDDATEMDIFRECQAGRAMCLACEDGFVIVTLVPAKFESELELVVWLAVSTGPNGAFERQEPNVDSIARELGAKTVVFHTRRKGWEKKLSKEWKLRSITYVKEVG